MDRSLFCVLSMNDTWAWLMTTNDKRSTKASPRGGMHVMSSSHTQANHGRHSATSSAKTLLAAARTAAATNTTRFDTNFSA
jgi:hypothetical protein